MSIDVAAGPRHYRPLRVGAAAVAANGRRSLWAAESWHSARRRPLPVIGDGAITAAVAGGITGSLAVGVLSAATLVAAGLLFGLFRPRMSIETQGVAWYPRPLLPTTAAIFAVLVTHVDGTTDTQAWQVAVVVFASLTLLRVVLWTALGMARRRGRGLRPTLVIGPSERIDQIEHRLRTFPEAGLAYAGAHIPTGEDFHHPIDGAELVERLLSEHPVDQVLCVVDDVDEAVFRDFVRFAGDRVDCGLVLPVPGIAAHQTRAHLGDLAVIPIRGGTSWGSRAAKRAFDLVAATIGLVAISPLLALVALAIRLGDGGPTIFRQARVGRDGRNFTIYKFRSMVVDAEARRGEHLASNINTEGLLFKLEEDPRITPLGAIIRRLSIDELPQLVNVIRGDMSLVGPRPLPVEPDDFDVAAQIRHRVAPGITGLWQVHGANALPYSDMVDLDMTYVTTRSLGLDLAVLARTLPAIVVRRAAY